MYRRKRFTITEKLGPVYVSIKDGKGMTGAGRGRAGDVCIRWYPVEHGDIPGSRNVTHIYWNPTFIQPLGHCAITHQQYAYHVNGQPPGCKVEFNETLEDKLTAIRYAQVYILNE